MQIVKTSRYLVELEEVISFIAQDNLTRALEFADKLNNRVLEIDVEHHQKQMIIMFVNSSSMVM
ncbi:MAG: hypothetical protein KU38_10100 [Sulfurovum sp. FS08-3]|nr:MAG: hypothetical protein KU38_10100 [Sulfurovum sp. FS08-3]